MEMLKYKGCFLGGFVMLLLLSSSPMAQANQEVDQFFALGQKAYDAGDYEKAIGYYEKVVEIDPNYAPVFNALGLAYQGTSAPVTDVVWFYKVALDIDPKNVEAYTNICRAYYEAQEGDLAEQSCRKALEVSPGPSIKLTLAWVYLRLKQQPNEAISYFEDVLKVGQAPAIYFGLGMAHAMRGDRGEVLEIVTKLREMGSEEFAGQLENMIRAMSAPAEQQPVASNMPEQQMPMPQQPQRQQATLVPGTATPPPTAMGPNPSAVSSDGVMRVRLKGKLSTAPINPDEQVPTTAAAQPQAVTPDHPGSLTTEESPETPQESAMERIRQLRRFRGSTAHPTY